MYRNITLNFGTTVYNHSSVKFARESHITDACHDMFEFIYVADGSGSYSAEGAIGKLSQGTVMLFAPYEYHKIIPTLNTPLDIYRVRFNRAELVGDVLLRFDSIVCCDIAKRILLNHSVVIHSLLERIESANLMQHEDRVLYVKMMLSEIIMLLSFDSGKIAAREKGELGARVIKYLNENIDRDLSLDYIAQRFFVSKYHLCRAFKKHNGISVHGYINKKRVLYAKSLIEAGESAQDAAYKVGFGDYSAFYRAYVKQFGSSPTQDIANKINEGEE